MPGLTHCFRIRLLKLVQINEEMSSLRICSYFLKTSDFMKLAFLGTLWNIFKMSLEILGHL